MRSAAAAFVLAWATYAGTAFGCTVGSQVPEQDLPDAVLRNEFVFVARLAGYMRLPPAPGEEYFRGRMAFEVVERIKGEPGAGAMLVERTTVPAYEGLPPGPSCGPFVVAPYNDGAMFIVFALRDDETGYLRPDPRSYRLGIPGSEPERWLDLVRTTHYDSLTP